MNGFKFEWYTPHKIKKVRDINTIPKVAKYVHFDYSFNQSVDSLSQSITYLTFGEKFNQHVDYLS